MLFAWLESGPLAEAEAAGKDIPMPDVISDSPFSFTLQETPVDFPFWLEQGMDPTHANFLHHSCKAMRGT
jgi:phenylpropionate dioxygenase-like ring-hydroxylating dioxygenase large terminal subunit